MNDYESILATLKPTKNLYVMDLVEESGIDVTSWKYTSIGNVVKRPKANPQYCYEWSFGGSNEPIALCVWHKHLKFNDSEIYYEDNLWEFAQKLESLTFDKRLPQSVKTRSRAQAKRARRFDLFLQKAFTENKPLRIILLVGDDLGKAEIGWDSSKVEYRKLDTELWQIFSYSKENGSFKLIRGYTANHNLKQELPEVGQFADQFEIPRDVETSLSVSKKYDRRRDVRMTVLARSKGECELCREPGFKISDEKIYLETHHVIPLNESGYDEVWNVVALCPNDHKKAHFSISKSEIRTTLIQKLIDIYPNSKDYLMEIKPNKSTI